jgi:hypothetical protein
MSHAAITPRYQMSFTASRHAAIALSASDAIEYLRHFLHITPG